MIANRSNEAHGRGSSRWTGENPAGEQRGVLLASLIMFVSGWGWSGLSGGHDTAAHRRRNLAVFHSVADLL